MSCACVSTAIFMENENERLRSRIKHLEKKVKKYQEELLVLYSSGSEYSTPDSSNESSPYRAYKVLYIPQRSKVSRTPSPVSANDTRASHASYTRAIRSKG